MRTNRELVILAAVLATTVVSSPAVAETAAGEAAPATVQPTPKVAAAAPPRAAQPALWREGFMLLPSVGINSFQGDSGQDAGIGLRLGVLAGSRMGELWSLNVGLAVDKVNVEAPNTSDYVFDLGFHPLLHFPQDKLEILAGPAFGVFLDKMGAGSGSASIDTWAYGWTVGANAGLLFRVGANVRLGGLLNFSIRNPIKICVTTNGTDSCGSSGLPSEKVLALGVAALL